MNPKEAKERAAKLADRYIAKDGSAPDLSRLEAIGSLSPAEYGARRVDLAEEMETSLKFLDDEYRERRKAAKADGGRDSDFLPDAEPWPDPVNGADLLDEISAAASRHIVLPLGAADAIALWSAFTHAHDCFDISPMLAVTSPTPECGKTTLLRLLAAVSARALSASNVSPAAVFRVVEKWGPTLLIDEADTFARDNDELRGILNCGHDRSGAFVIRNVGDSFEPRRFSTWGPKAIAMIGKLPATWQSRSIVVALKRMYPGESVEPLRPGRTSHLESLKRKARRWALDRADKLRNADPAMPPSLYGRAADNWRPLLAIADLAGGDWPKRARRVAEKLGGRYEDLAPVMVLHDVYTLFGARGVDRLSSAEIVLALGQMEDRPWPEWKSGKPITARQLAKLLDDFGIVPVTVTLPSGKTPKGYHLRTFHECVRRYPPNSASQSAISPYPLETQGFSDLGSAATNFEAADLNSEKPQKPNGYGGTADTEPEKEDFATHIPSEEPSDGDPFAFLKDDEWRLQ